MSRFRAWWRTSLCRVLGHRWHQPDRFETWCARCGDVRANGPTRRLSVAFDHLRHDLRLPSPTPPSSSSRVYRRVTPEDTNESIAAWRAVWAQASDAHTLPSLLDRDTESASAPHSAGR